MSQAATPAPVATTEDKILPAVVYGLYLVSVPSVFLSLILGLVIAYVARGSAGPVMETHYSFQIASFWKSIWWRVIAVLMFGAGLALAIFLIGVPVMVAAVFIWAVVEIWFVVRCIAGLLHLFKGEPYPRPNAWLI